MGPGAGLRGREGHKKRDGREEGGNGGGGEETEGIFAMIRVNDHRTIPRRMLFWNGKKKEENSLLENMHFFWAHSKAFKKTDPLGGKHDLRVNVK